MPNEHCRIIMIELKSGKEFQRKKPVSANASVLPSSQLCRCDNFPFLAFDSTITWSVSLQNELSWASLFFNQTISKVKLINPQFWKNSNEWMNERRTRYKVMWCMQVVWQTNSIQSNGFPHSTPLFDLFGFENVCEMVFSKNYGIQEKFIGRLVNSTRNFT